MKDLARASLSDLIFFFHTDNTSETRSKQMGETLFSKRYEFTYKYKKLIGGRKKNAYITAYPQNNPLH